MPRPPPPGAPWACVEGIPMARPIKALIVAAVALVTVGALPLASFAGENPPPTVPAAAHSFDMAPGMLAAMRRDLKLDDDQIAARLRTEAAAPVIERRLRSRLGTDFAGAWIPSGASRLTVAVTEESATAVVRAEGADVMVVKRSASELTRSRKALDAHAAEAKGGPVRGWYIDVATNSVVVMARPGAEAAANAIKDGGIVSWVNLSEVVATMIERGASDASVRDRIAFLNLETRDFSREDAFAAGFLRRQTKVYGLSFGDRACLALAQSLEMPALTADRNWPAVDLAGLRVELIR